MELTVVIPTGDRPAILSETLARLERQRGDVEYEVVVVDGGSPEGTAAVVERHALAASRPVTLLTHPGATVAVARNLAVESARAPICLFIDDDTHPRADVLKRHRDFHARRPEAEAALLGRIELAPAPPPTPFMRWLATIHLGHNGAAASSNVGGERFLGGHVSVKTSLLRSVGGFDERFREHEDIDLGLRLQRRGVRLAYDADTVVEHCHPVDLSTTIGRMHRIGRSLAVLIEQHPDYPEPTCPGLRHRLKAAYLTAFAAIGYRTPRLQRETWRFLCHQATREGYWSAVAGRNGSEAGQPLRIGGTLARLAMRDHDARMPPGFAAHR